MKYWDIIPPKKINKLERLKRLMEKYEGTTSFVVDHPVSTCLHDNCPNCRGTGRGALGNCIHAISCPCYKCSPTMVAAPYDPHTYKVVSRGDMIPYNPNLVSVSKKIIMA